MEPTHPYTALKHHANRSRDLRREAEAYRLAQVARAGQRRGIPIVVWMTRLAAMMMRRLHEARCGWMAWRMQHETALAMRRDCTESEAV